MSAILFEITHRCASTHARAGRIDTPHGSFETPAFMPVGTRASVKGLLPSLVRDAGAQIILNNAYHLMLRPAADLIRRRGGVHAFMQWDGPILTDSGGYQAFSMSDINRIDESGVTFKSIVDGSEVHLGPERSIEVQNDLGADMIMAFDDCPPANAEMTGLLRDRVAIANERTARWLERCVKAHARRDEQALFGIVQGGTDLDLRAVSVERVCSFDLPGFAIGGVAVGESPQEMQRVVEFTAPLLPGNRPRYLMGVGYEHDLVMAVRAGCDMFDCVLPTRNGRNGGAFTRHGRIQIRNAGYAEDDGPIDPSCSCVVCRSGAGPPFRHFSRAYIRHLFQSGEMLGPILLSVHNISHFQRLMVDIRRAIRENDWFSLSSAWPVLGNALAPGGESREPL